MPYFLANQTLRLGQEFDLSGEEFQHLVVKRAKSGELIKFQDPQGQRYNCEVLEVNKKNAKLRVLKLLPLPAEAKLPVSLFVSVVAEQALDNILQKATELGAAEIVLFNSQFTATKLSASRFEQKRGRWEKILWAAAKQCERVRIPTIKFLTDLNSAVVALAKFDRVLVFDISGHKFGLTGHLSNLAVVIGPEGGLGEQELSRLKKLPNAHLVRLGPLLLRVDTAATAALVITQQQLN